MVKQPISTGRTSQTTEQFKPVFHATSGRLIFNPARFITISRNCKPSPNASLSNADFIVRMEINASKYFPNAKNLFIRSLLNTL